MKDVALYRAEDLSEIKSRVQYNRQQFASNRIFCSAQTVPVALSDIWYRRYLRRSFPRGGYGIQTRRGQQNMARCNPEVVYFLPAKTPKSKTPVKMRRRIFRPGE